MRLSRMSKPLLHVAAVLSVVALAASVLSAQSAADTSGRKRIPKAYLAVFMNGYGSDTMPADDAQFDKMLAAIVKDGHFNAIMCQYSPTREEMCKKHNVYMVVDLLAFPHVYKNVAECEALLKKLQDSTTVAAYHLWSDRFGKQGAGRARDIDTVHKWDPNHATWSGTYTGEHIRYLGKSDLVGNYDFSWQRGPHKNYTNLMAQWRVAKPNDTRLSRYCGATVGQVGKGNFNRLLYIQTTSIAFGLRAATWHIASGIFDFNTCQFNEAGKELAKMNAWIEPMREEIAKIGLPDAIYSTPWTKNQNNEPVEGKDVMPPAMGNDNKFPADFWLQPQSGEFVMGVSKYNYTDQDVVFIANHNAYAEQDVKIKTTKSSKPKLFNRATGKYEELKLTDGAFSFKLEAGGGAIVLFE
ncbi:MAG: hypothetical protein ABFD92_14210 [Planctomycetaceae bacterium]|nr:hypothetical protein [Planctomycetaceae bacterium]